MGIVMDTSTHSHLMGYDAAAANEPTGLQDGRGTLSILLTQATPCMANAVLSTLRSLPGCEVHVVSGPDPMRRLSGFEVTRRTARGGLAPGTLRRVRAYVDSKLSERMELSDLAMIAGLSECHFARAFRESMGITPHRYVVWRRVEEAARLLRETDLSLADVALAVGFADQSHFTRRFLRHAGETPGAFRNRAR